MFRVMRAKYASKPRGGHVEKGLKAPEKILLGYASTHALGGARCIAAVVPVTAEV
jgi:hypothetical protein